MCWMFAACALFASSAFEALPFPPWLQTLEPCKHWNLYPQYLSFSRASLRIASLQCDLSSKSSIRSINSVTNRSNESGLYQHVNNYSFHPKETQCVEHKLFDQVANDKNSGSSFVCLCKAFRVMTCHFVSSKVSVSTLKLS